MKKLLFLIVLILTLSGCASDNGLASNEKVLSKDEFKNCYEIIEITKDNWKNYFEIVERTLNDGNKDLMFKIKDEYLDGLCGSPEVDAVLEIKYHVLDGEFNADTGECIYPYSDKDTSTTSNVYNYPKNSGISKGTGVNLNETYILNTYYEGNVSYDDWRNVNIQYKTIYSNCEVEAISITGKLSYANIPNESYNTNKLGEKYITFTIDDGTKYALFDNGLVRWERGSGYGYINGKDFLNYDYYSFFEE